MVCRHVQIQPRLHQRQRRAQFMSGVAYKLLLSVEGLLQPQQHLIDGAAQPAELRRLVLAEGDLRQALQLHALCLGGELLQRL